MTVVLAVLIAAAGIGYALSRVSRIRKELPELAEAEKKPKRQSKREKRLEQIRAEEPEYVPPSIDDLIAEEIAETGVKDIPGGEGLPAAVLLKVFRRDTHTAESCPPADRRFVLADGVEPASAGVDDVRLICEGHPAVPMEPAAADGSDDTEPAGE